MCGPSSRNRSVFVSYSPADRALASGLAAGLRARGIEVWIESEALEPGRSWAEAIDQMLANARYCIVLVSVGSNPADPHTSIEWSKIQGSIWARRNLQVLPVIIGDAEIPPFLRRWQALRVSDKADMDALVEDVINALGADAVATPTISEHELERTRKRFDEIRSSLAGIKYSP